MANNAFDVSPPPQEDIPAKFAFDPEVSGFFVAIQRAEFDLWNRLGGGTDRFVGIEDRLDDLELRVTDLEARMTAVEDRVTYLEGLVIITAVDVTIDNTVTGHQTIICTEDLTVTYAATPNDKDKTTVVSQGNEVTIDGNGNLINGESTVILRRGFEIGLDTIYSSTQGEHFEV